MRWGLDLRSIRNQIFLLATLPIILLSMVASVFWLSINDNDSREEWASNLVGRIEMVADQVRLAGDKPSENAVLQASARAGLSVEMVSANEIVSTDGASGASSDVDGLLLRQWRSKADRSMRSVVVDGKMTGFLAIRIDSGRALAFRLPQTASFRWFTKTSVRGLMVIALIMLAALPVAFYASARITSPLIRFAADAKRISLDDTAAELFHATGASEIQSLAESLNTMRDRIKRMFEDRTQMLRAVSHDLRTPLTRLRMRAERSHEPELRRSMLVDISTLTAMTDECLTFLNKLPVSEVPRKVDLTSLLQTMVADFSDVGVAVTFKGPRRLAYICQPQAITRAVSNVIDNASRFANRIDIELSDAPDGGAFMTISDDGPGLSEALKKRVLEPFFKVDESRKVGAKGGFGLGLPISKGIVQHHNGTLRLSDRIPNGLVVEIFLPPTGGLSKGERRGAPLG